MPKPIPVNELGSYQFQTPEWVCKLMVSRLDHRVITICEPTPGEGNLLTQIKKTNKGVLYPPDNYWRWEHSYTIDAFVMNPPFSPATEAYRFLYDAMEKASVQIIALMPWWVIINSQKRTEAIYEWGLREVIHLPRSVFPGTRIQTCILDMVRGYTGKILFTLGGINA